MSDLKKIDIVS